MMESFNRLVFWLILNGGYIYIYIFIFIKKNLQICLSCIPPTRIQDRWSLFDCFPGGHDSWHLG